MTYETFLTPLIPILAAVSVFIPLFHILKIKSEQKRGIFRLNGHWKDINSLSGIPLDVAIIVESVGRSGSIIETEVSINEPIPYISGVKIIRNGPAYKVSSGGPGARTAPILWARSITGDGKLRVTVSNTQRDK